MSTRPTPEEAARSLRDVDRRTGQALESTVDSRWAYVVCGLGVFATAASYDIDALRDHSAWITSAWVLPLAAYSMLRRSRRGSRFVGQPAYVHKDALSPVARRVGMLSILAVALVPGVTLLTGTHLAVHLPAYVATVVGALVGAALIGFGPAIQRRWVSLFQRTPVSGLPRTDGSR